MRDRWVECPRLDPPPGCVCAFSFRSAAAVQGAPYSSDGVIMPRRSKQQRAEIEAAVDNAIFMAMQGKAKLTGADE
jgi:hypothetical protein